MATGLPPLPEDYPITALHFWRSLALIKNYHKCLAMPMINFFKAFGGVQQTTMLL